MRISDCSSDVCSSDLPVERGLEALVVAQRLAAPDEAQDLVGRGAHQPRRPQARVLRLHDLRGRPYLHVRITNRGDAVPGSPFHADVHVAPTETYGFDWLRIAEQEETIVRKRDVSGKRGYTRWELGGGR